MSSRVEIDFFDTTLRDGAQSLPEQNQFPKGAKAGIASHIARLGIGIIEAGFPRTEGDDEEVKAVVGAIGDKVYETQSWQNGSEIELVTDFPVIAGLCRTKPEDIDITWESIQDAKRARIHTFVSTDKEHMEAKFPGKTPDQVLDMGRQAVMYARKISADHPSSSVEFSAEAASTTDAGYLERVVKTAIEEGADVINLPDTVGQRNPFWMRRFYDQAFKWIMDYNPDVILSAHNHNDFDMAVANSLALVLSAIDHAVSTNRAVGIQIESTICHLGERAGNADIFPVAARLYNETADIDVPVTWQFNPHESVSVALSVMGFAGLSVNRQNAIVGEDINVHRSGIHSDGVIKGGHKIYTPYNPTFWGHHSEARHEEGIYQGANGRRVIAEQGKIK